MPFKDILLSPPLLIPLVLLFIPLSFFLSPSPVFDGPCYPPSYPIRVTKGRQNNGLMKLLRPVVPLIAGPLQLQKIELCFLTVGCVRITYRRERRASENESIPRLAEANKQQLRPNDCL